MHARELVELAGLIATHSSIVVRELPATPTVAAERYWSASKCRLDSWARALKNYSQQVESRPTTHCRPHWEQVRPVLEEILLSEILSRVWAAASLAHDRRHGVTELEPVARSVLIGHLEARHRTLNLMVYGRGFAVEDAVELNRLRRRCERWSDLLLAHVGPPLSPTLAFDAARLRDFRRELADYGHHRLDRCTRQLVLASLSTAFRQSTCPAAPHAELNRQIAASLLQHLPARIFSATGTLYSCWLLRLTRTTDDAQGMLELLLDDGPESGRRGESSSGASRPRWAR